MGIAEFRTYVCDVYVRYACILCIIMAIVHPAHTQRAVLHEATTMFSTADATKETKEPRRRQHAAHTSAFYCSMGIELVQHTSLISFLRTSAVSFSQCSVTGRFFRHSPACEAHGCTASWWSRHRVKKSLQHSHIDKRFLLSSAGFSCAFDGRTSSSHRVVDGLNAPLALRYWRWRKHEKCCWCRRRGWRV